MRVIARYDDPSRARMYVIFRGKGSVINLPSDKHPDKPWAVVDDD